MSYFSKFWGSDKFNSSTYNININLSWVIYITFKFVDYIDCNSEFYNELIAVYEKYNIVVQDEKLKISRELNIELLKASEEFCNENFENFLKKDRGTVNSNEIMQAINKYRGVFEEIMIKTKQNKYTHFPFDNAYSKYTGIDKKFFGKLKE